MEPAKDNILCWMVEDLPAFIISKFLKEKYDCNLYGIIHSDKNVKSFVNSQKFVNFEKVWYYEDIPDDGLKIDLQYLRNVEKKYNLDLWKIVNSDRLLISTNKYHSFSHEKILQILLQDCKFFEKILDDINPDFLIMRPTDDHQMELLHKICLSKNIRILTYSVSRLGYRTILSQNSDHLDIPFIFDPNISKNSRSFENLKNYGKNYSKQFKTYSKKYNRTFLRRLTRFFPFFIFEFNNDYKYRLANYGKTPFKILSLEIITILKKIYREFFINRNSLHEINTLQPFIYFPLHLEPERATMIASPFYVDQLEVIRRIAKSLPVTHKLYVKEHPLQGSTGWKSTSYYKEIINLPNVELLYTLISNEEIMKNCSMTITITGSAGLESIFYQKPVIVFGNTIYSEISSVQKINNIEELPAKIKLGLNSIVSLSELNQFVDFIEDNSFEFDLYSLDTEILSRFYFKGIASFSDIPISELGLFMEDYKESFQLLASEYVKKINYHKSLIP